MVIKIGAIIIAVLGSWQAFAQADASQPEGRADQSGLAAAKSLLERGMPADAEREARQYLAFHNNSAKGHFLLGYILFRETKARESLAEYTEGAQYERPSAADLSVVGADYVLLSDYGDADKWFTKATEWAPDNVLDWYYLGRTKYNENRFEEAVSAFEHCLRLDGKNVRAEDNLGLSLQALGRGAEAREAFLKAIDWQAGASTKDPWPYIDIGSFLLEGNEPEKAAVYLRQGLAIAPDTSKAHQQLGKAYLAMQEPGKAEKELQEAVRLEPDNARSHYVLGQLYAKEGQGEKAKREFARYSELNSAHPERDTREYHAPGSN